MKKIIFNFFLLLFIFVTFLLIYLSTFGIETVRFNSLLIDQVQKKDKDINLELKKIKIKLDIKNFKVLILTQTPTIKYKNTNLPFSEIKLFFTVSSLIKSKPYLVRSVIESKMIKIEDFQKILIKTKPSNYKSFVLNRISKGKVKGLLDLSFTDELKVKNFDIEGRLDDTNIKLKDEIILKKVSLDFEAKNNLFLIKNLKANLDKINIENGKIDVINNEEIKVKGSFNSILSLESNDLKNILILNNYENFFKNKINIDGNLLNSFDFKLNKTLEMIDFNYGVKGVFSKSKIYFNNKIKNAFLEKEIENIEFSNSNLELKINKQEKLLKLDTSYKTNNFDNFEDLSILADLNKNESEVNIKLKTREIFILDLINYKSSKKNSSEIQTSLLINKKQIFFKNLEFVNDESKINIKKLKLNKNFELINVADIKVKTFQNKKKNNDFMISYGKIIKIKGDIFDSSNLIKNVTKDKNNNSLKSINKNIEINFNNIITKSLIPLKKFNLIGKIEKGSFVKISSKSDFTKDKHLDISLSIDKKTNLKTLEIFSDLARPLLEDYNFFKGINEGKLFLTSTFDESGSNSNLVIENFKVINAPAFATLLTVADLKGIADLLSGEGISFDVLEIKFNQDKKTLKVEEIYAIGSSISILMDGYVEKDTDLVSMRGTMVPAKNLNQLISKIPVLGDILVGKEIGEGIFGVSFKLKGPPDKIKTTINPVKTLTPRFITRALEKRKKRDKAN